MARYAPVVPLEIARYLKDIKLLGDYHLLLAHDILERPREYQDVYSDIPNVTIILDNSIIELGKPLDMDSLLRAAEIIKPRYLVIPDVMGDADATLAEAEMFTRSMTRCGSKIPLMAVVHGKTKMEAFQCARFLKMMLGVGALSVPRVLTQLLGTRMEVVNEIVRKYPYLALHLLGFSDDLLDDIACARVPGVMGIDSAVPVRGALQHKIITLDSTYNVGPRGAFWSQTVPDEDTGTYVIANVVRVRSWIHTNVSRT